MMVVRMARQESCTAQVHARYLAVAPVHYFLLMVEAAVDLKLVAGVEAVVNQGAARLDEQAVYY